LAYKSIFEPQPKQYQGRSNPILQCEDFEFCLYTRPDSNFQTEHHSKMSLLNNECTIYQLSVAYQTYEEGSYN